MFGAQRKREALGRGTPKILPRALQHTRCENVGTRHTSVCTRVVNHLQCLVLVKPEGKVVFQGNEVAGIYITHYSIKKKKE